MKKEISTKKKKTTTKEKIQISQQQSEKGIIKK